MSYYRTHNLEHTQQLLMEEIHKLEENDTVLTSMEKDLNVGHSVSFWFSLSHMKKMLLHTLSIVCHIVQKSVVFTERLVPLNCPHTFLLQTWCSKGRGLSHPCLLFEQIYWKKQMVAFHSFVEQETLRWKSAPAVYLRTERLTLLLWCCYSCTNQCRSHSTGFKHIL